MFRAHGYEGTSLTLITQATGLGKGSLYNLFPRGKEQMAEEVLSAIDAWFERNVFAPLRDDKTGEGVEHMFEATDRYFKSGGRVCLVGVFALGGARDTFGKKLRGYFKAWEEALAAALRRRGHDAGAGERPCGRSRARHPGRTCSRPEPMPTTGCFHEH